MLIKVKEKMRTIKRLKLKELREEHGIAQGDIAAKAGVSQAFLSAVENGRRPASDKLKQVLIDQFHVDNLEDYEIEVETDDIKGYSFNNAGQYIESQSGGNSSYYDYKGQSPISQQENSQLPSLEIMTQVIQDYRNQIEDLRRERDEIKQELRDAKEEIRGLEQEVKNLQKKVIRLKK